MPFPTPFRQYHLLCIFLIFSISFSPSHSDPRISEAGLYCGTSQQSDQKFIQNFTKLMVKLKEIVFNQRWGVDSVLYPPIINGFAQCHEDLSQTDCNLCFSVARGKLSTCLPSSSGVVYLDGCYARYSDKNIVDGGPIDQVTNNVKCSPATGVLKEKFMIEEFQKKLEWVMENVTKSASMNHGFAVGEVKRGVTSVYALAQCWKTVNDLQCGQCLKNAQNVLGECKSGNGGRFMNAGCFLRYSTDKFFGAEAESNSTSKVPIIIGSALGAVSITMLLIFGAFVGYKRLSKKREEHNNLGWVSDRINKSSLCFKYETLEKATEFFHSSMKLGEGGAGSVYKGNLPDGEVVAVKRLFYSTRQWVDEFFNEVNLISGVKHKNLVKLFGCSIEGPESLVVYEYVSNGNLEEFLNEKTRTRFLNWQQRIGIIIGMADGLAYLHGGSASPLKIIHRDIKGSNILLDENLTPKIADFGLVRCLAGDKSHISTGIAGTLGYMAPEYLVRGQLTEKADVYAFGVLVLEIVCGRRNTVFSGGSSSVLQSVWNHYKSNRLPETVDPSLQGDFPAKEASNVLQIGLLCTQASAALRPSMSEVFQMLNGEEIAIPSPKQPPFLNSSVLGTDNTTKSFTLKDLSLNTATTTEGFFIESDGLTIAEGSAIELDGLTTAEGYSSHSISPSAACPEPKGHSEVEKSEQR